MRRTWSDRADRSGVLCSSARAAGQITRNTNRPEEVVTDMKCRMVPLLVLGFLAGCSSESGPEPEAEAFIDTDYVLALSAADRFLAAWRSRHQDDGLTMLSSRLVKSKGEQHWRDEISGISNPHHQAYEISGGRRLGDGRFAFDVWLYEHYTGFRVEPGPRGKPRRIILIKVAPEEWKVDEVPDYL